MLKYLNFITPINKIFPCPRLSASSKSKVFLVLNSDGDLSLYRNSDHIWSAGRFKKINDVQWSPDGRFIALQCDKKFFIYSSEDGKRLASYPIDNSNCSCRWIKLGESDFTIILALFDFKSQTVNWSVNCEFELKGGRLPAASILENDTVAGVQIDTETNDILISLNSKKIVKIKFPFENSFLLRSSKLSKQLQVLLRLNDNVKGQFQKLIKLSSTIYARITEIDKNLLQKLILFGLKLDEAGSFTSALKDSDILEWKSRLKKLHAELLVSIQELSNNSIEGFCTEIVEKFMNSSLEALEIRGKGLQHDLAEVLVWLEGVIIEKSVNKAFSPSDEKNLKLLQRIRQTTDNPLEDALVVFDQFKRDLEVEFKKFIETINSVDLESFNEINRPAEFDRFLLVNPFILLLSNQNGRIHLISTDFKSEKTLSLPDEYVTHYVNCKNQIIIICKGFNEIIIDKDMSAITRNNSPLKDHFEQCGSISIVNHPSSMQLYATSGSDSNKLYLF